MPAVKLINPNRVNIHGILFERGIPRYVTSEIAEALANDERFEIRDGEDIKGGVKIKRSSKAKQADKTESVTPTDEKQSDDSSPDNGGVSDDDNPSTEPVIEV